MTRTFCDRCTAEVTGVIWTTLSLPATALGPPADLTLCVPCATDVRKFVSTPVQPYPQS